MVLDLKRLAKAFAATLGFALVATACSDEGWSNGPANPAAAFGGYERLVLEVDYEPGAEPYTVSRGSFVPWQLMKDNVEALFAGTSAAVQVPLTLPEMQKIDDQPKSDFSTDELLLLAERYLTTPSSRTQLTYYLLFLDGYFFKDEKRQTSVLGVTIAEKRVIALFKPVIDQNPTERLRIFVEQSTLVHEFGHAVGLVNNGLRLVTQHHDAAHGAHCTNERCVMYYLNEGFEDLSNFANQLLSSGSVVLFGEECLKDVRAASPDPA